MKTPDDARRTSEARILRFGVFELDALSLELTRSGRPVPLAPQPARVLLYLAGNRGRVVGREELAGHVWGEGTFVDAEAGLHSAVKQVRAALGDSSRGARFVETLPRRGYRFVAPVETVSPRRREQEPRRRWRRPVAVAAAVAALAAGLYLARDRPPPPAAGTPAAVDAYFKGRYILTQNASDSGSRAAAMFERALELDPDSVPALVGLAESRLRTVGEGRLTQREAWTEVAAAAARALAVDPRSAPARGLRARARWYLDWDWRGAEADFVSALRRAPEDAPLRQSYAFLLSALGRHDDALAEIRTARRLDPLSPAVNHDVAWIHYYARRYEGAVAEGLRSLELSPGLFSAHHCLSAAYAALGRTAEAMVHARAMTVAAGAGEETTAAGGAGGDAGGQRILDWWLEEGPLPAYSRAIVELGRERPDRAVDLLQQSLDRLEWSVAMAGVDPRLDPLRGRPDFDSFLGRLNLPAAG